MAGESILIVDDDIRCVRLLSDVLAHHGYQIRTANSGENACDIVQAGYRPSLVLMDIQMPGIGGVATVQILRKVEGMSGVRVVAMTASVMPHEVASLYAGGIDKFHPKPLDIAKLLDEVRGLIDLR